MKGRDFVCEFFQKMKDSYFAIYMRKNPLHAFGVIYMAISLVLVIIGPMIVPHSPITTVPEGHLLPPSSKYWFGTDANGMCVFSRCIAAFRTDVLIAFTGSLLSMFIGAPVGVFAGYFDGRGGIKGYISMLILRFEDVVQAFPVFVLALLLVAAFGPSAINLIIAIFAINHISNLRLARAEVLSLREKAFVEAARASGNSDLRIAFVHLMPNAMTQVIALISLVMGFGILLTAGLSFVGAGIRVPTPEWGIMIAIGGPSMITGQWWPSFFPGAIMGVTIFAFSMVGEALTHLLDPIQRIRLGYKR
ncbi:MAG: ABC transporter permease [Candidatus Hodarchaeota archaeon]